MEDVLSKSARMVFFFFIIADFGETVKFSLSFEFFFSLSFNGGVSGFHLPVFRSGA